MPPKPLILSFDTSAAHVAAALVSGEQVLAQHFEERTKGQGEVLMDIVSDLLQQGGAKRADITTIAVGVGPGNFTGIRLSVAAARGLALGLGIPAIGVSTLDALAWDAPAACITAVTAPRGQVYAQYQDEAPGLFPADALPPTWVQAADFVAGSGAQAVGDATDLPTHPAATSLAVALAQVAKERGTYIQARPTPLYLKAADAAPGKTIAPIVV